MSINRRSFIKLSTISAGVMAVANLPILAFAAISKNWNKKAFDNESLEGVLQDLYSTTQHTPSDKIKFKTPEIAENGAAVPIKLKTSLDNVDSIAIFAAKNQRPLVAYFSLTPSSLPEVSTRVKLAETGNVLAIVKVGNKLHSVVNEVKVTIGGCGG